MPPYKSIKRKRFNRLTLAQLYSYAEKRGIDIDYFPMREVESASFPCGWIAIDTDKLSGADDEKVHLAHEIGHIETGCFYRCDTSLEIRSRLELRADRWAIKKLIPAEEYYSALRCGVTTPWELAEYFGVPQTFMEKAIAYYSAA